MNSKHYEDQLLDAIETIVSSAVSKADYDKTIRAVIQSCLDENTGKYKIKYQDSTFEAYSNNLEVKYPDNTQVYILIPRNDMSQTKVILHAVDRDTIEYSSLENDNQHYEILSDNIINGDNYNFCSYKGEQTITLYDRDNKINLINFSEEHFAETLTEAEGFLFGADFKTNLPKEQRKKGNYGIAIEIDFLNNASNTTVTRSYSVDVNNMSGNPYYLLTDTEQIINFAISNDNYISIKDIYIFAKNFPKTEDGKEDDIFISNFQLHSTKTISDGYSVRVKMEKNFFDDNDNRNDKINVIADMYWNGRPTDGDKFEYYWFRRNSNITEESEKYIKYAGAGWECLNKTLITDSQTGEYSFVTGNNNYSIIKANCLAVNNDFRIVAVSNNYAISKDFVIKNYSSDFTISIESDSGDTFYYDNGSPTLTAYINGLEDTDNFYYVWSKIDNNKQFNTLRETTDYNQEYKVAVTSYETLQSRIDAGQAMAAASKYELNKYLTTIKKYDTIQRVEKNHIYHLELGAIDKQMTFICSVFNTSRVLIGSASLTIYNTTAVEGEYTVLIENGTQSFSYDVNGDSPASRWLDKPIQIEPLKVVLKDNSGNTFSDTLMQVCDIKWTIPENSLIIAEDSGNAILEYSLEEKYDITKIDNNVIQVDVIYRGHTYSARTNFTFVKDGEPGTNGTDIICKIVPNIDDTFYEYPMLINGKLNFIPKNTKKWFKVQIWKNGSMIWEGAESGSGAFVTWKNLINSYDYYIKDPHAFNIEYNDFSYNAYQENGANIIQAEVYYNGNTYYATLPLITLDLRELSYNIKLEKDTGFRYVMYASNGKYPKYDNILPFTLKVTQQINGYVEDITNINNQYKVTYDWSIKGRKYIGSWEDDLNMEFKEISTNTAMVIPTDDYTGENVSNALQVEIKHNGSLVGRIHIPIHFYLDRYSIAAINEWDGNSISLNDDKGIILSPQVGAGSKDSNNRFTGVLMGAVKEQASDEIEQGLLGYYQGQRTIFLDSKTGKATFGKQGQGQIIIDPSGNTAKIYGGNYSEAGRTGMLIDLTKPEIKWGNGKFSVNEKGELKAVDAQLSGTIDSTEGHIGGFTLSQDSLTASLSSEHFSNYIYTWGDVDTIVDIIAGEETPTAEDYVKYDFNENGKIDTGDVIILMKYLNSGYVGTGTFELNTKDFEKALVIKDSNGKNVCQLGILGNYFDSVSNSLGVIPYSWTSWVSFIASSTGTPTIHLLTYPTFNSTPYVYLTPRTDSPEKYGTFSVEETGVDHCTIRAYTDKQLTSFSFNVLVVGT